MAPDKAKQHAAALFPNIDFTEFGRLVLFEYNGFTRPVVVHSLNKHHLRGHCLKRWIYDNDTDERAFNFDIITQFSRTITDLADGHIYPARGFYEQYLCTYYPERKFGHTFSDLRGKSQVYFTGFAAAERKALQAKATAANMWVTESMTENMAYLVCGPRAGQKKIDKARRMDTVLMSAEQFLHLLDTGEILKLE